MDHHEDIFPSAVSGSEIGSYEPDFGIAIGGGIAKAAPAEKPSAGSSSKLANRWNERYNLLAKYKLEMGHSSVHYKEEYEGVGLGWWVVAQRKAYQSRLEGKPSKMTARRVYALNKISFDWNLCQKKRKWEDRFAELVSFRETYGHSNVPRTCAENLYPGMGTWVAEQRKEFKKGRLNENRRQQLESLGFEFVRVTPRIQKLGTPVPSLGVGNFEAFEDPGRARVDNVAIADEAIEELERELATKIDVIAKNHEEIDHRDKEIQKLTKDLTKRYARERKVSKKDEEIRKIAEDLAKVQEQLVNKDEEIRKLKEELANVRSGAKIEDISL